MIVLGMRLSAYLSSICCAMLVVLHTGTAWGQLTVLSKGNPTAEWRKAQLAQIEAQLSDSATKAELKLELTAQKEWLTGYSNG